ncbi:hypothetical protein CFK37_12745 [Virgibacillus phasianinus]|uniref:DUF2953 domain-containing protein n=1 Tax=Virgibacillus phasianinus TaxID=2017483 RepID=A0A220U4A5_9BACI|nr:DUF2953 domain-containing protein [Virgibacillus phasianinus]ASK62949.1 hypothetical protein CFK37_12745 [Virgibacillus phasianinus]
MNVWLIVLCVLIVLVTFFLFSKIYVSVHYYLLNSKQQASIQLYFLKIPLYRRNIHSTEQKEHAIFELLKDENKLSSMLREGKLFLKGTKAAYPNIYWLLKKLSFHKFVWHTNVGAGEASSTGVLSGGVWSLKGLAVALLRQVSHVGCALHVTVNPLFQQKLINTEISMKFSIRLGQAILGGLKILRSFSKREDLTIKLRERKI